MLKIFKKLFLIAVPDLEISYNKTKCALIYYYSFFFSLSPKEKTLIEKRRKNTIIVYFKSIF